jgi:hypothetical protein
MAPGINLFLMKPPSSAITFETELATCWFDKHLLCIRTKNAKRTKKNTEEHYWILKSMIRDKICWLLELNVCVDFSMDARYTLEKELPAICKSIAIVAAKPCEKFLASFYLVLKNKGISVEIFETEKEARAWIESSCSS